MGEVRGATPAQTVGPFLAIALNWEDGPDAVRLGTPGTVTIGGRLLDGAAEPVPDGLVETWQADQYGAFHHADRSRARDASPSAFRGFGRCPTDADGRWSITTVIPGELSSPDGAIEAPHLDVSVFARGLLNRVVTRIYFPGDADALAADPVLQLVPDERRKTLIATQEGENHFKFDIVLQGADETVFFRL